MPLDVRIMGWIFFAASVVWLLIGLLLFTEISHIPPGDQRLTFFGMITLTSDMSFGMHSLVISLTGFLSFYGIMKGHRFGWWIALFLCINGCSDSILVFSQHRVAAVISILMSIGIIVWLVFRRRLYNIGKKAKNSVPTIKHDEL